MEEKFFYSYACGVIRGVHLHRGVHLLGWRMCFAGEPSVRLVGFLRNRCRGGHYGFALHCLLILTLIFGIFKCGGRLSWIWFFFWLV